jgi:hypothetical protein
MSANGYRALGFVVWHGGRWYLRRRGPRLRTLAARGLIAGAIVVAGVLIGRRLSFAQRPPARGERARARTPGGPPPSPGAVRATA